jgi:hypothetical protein
MTSTPSWEVCFRDGPPASPPNPDTPPLPPLWPPSPPPPALPPPPPEGPPQPPQPLPVLTVTGDCILSGNCIRSTGYPFANYDVSESCSVTGLPATPAQVIAFNTEANTGNTCTFDYVTIAGQNFCGTSGPEGVVAVDGSMTWRSDATSTRSGFEICFPQAPPASPHPSPRPPPLPLLKVHHSHHSHRPARGQTPSLVIASCPATVFDQ